MRCFTVLVCLLFSMTAMAVPAGHRNGARKLSTATRLIGTWHSTSVSGDGVGLAVDNVVVEFHVNKNFKATVNMTIGSPNVYEGTYDARLESVTLNAEGSGAIPCKVSFNGPARVTFVDANNGVTAVFERGEASSSSSGWF